MLTDGGFPTVERETLGDWKPGRDGVAVVAVIDNKTTLSDIAFFRTEHPLIPLVTVFEEISVDEYAAAIKAGATAAMGEDEPADVFVVTVQAALRGLAVVPSAVVQAMAVRVPDRPDPSVWTTPAEAGWLIELAAGKTVAEVAGGAGYSEREMFRLLQTLYARIGVTSRTEAIIWATRHGLLDS